MHDRDVFLGDLITSTESSQLLSRCNVVAAGAPVKCRVAEEESSPASAESHSRTPITTAPPSIAAEALDMQLDHDC